MTTFIYFITDRTILKLPFANDLHILNFYIQIYIFVQSTISAIFSATSGESAINTILSTDLQYSN